MLRRLIGVKKRFMGGRQERLTGAHRMVTGRRESLLGKSGRVWALVLAAQVTVRESPGAY